MFSEQAKDKGLELTVKTADSINYAVVGDAGRLSQILINLVGNAIKFTEAGSIDLYCKFERKDEKNASVQFKISDTGIGILSEKLAVIFERFTQADSNTTRRFGGTGLGLAISKQLIELMGGNIIVNSEPAVGTSFTFSLPFVIASNIPLSQEYSLGAEWKTSTSKTILVVEDNLLNQKLTGIILKNNGFSFLMAGNGLEAIKVLEKNTPDLILMDIQMPLMDGYEATCHIRDIMQIRIPIVAITAYALTGEKEKCIAQGINDYLAKPFTEAELLKTISFWLNKSSNPEKPIENKITDLSFLKKQTRNDVAVINEMITLFINENPKDLNELYLAVRSADYDAVYKKLHTLKNNIALFGIDKNLEVDILSMEAAISNKNPIAEIEQYFQQIARCCNKAQEELKNIIS